MIDKLGDSLSKGLREVPQVGLSLPDPRLYFRHVIMLRSITRLGGSRVVTDVTSGFSPAREKKRRRRLPVAGGMGGTSRRETFP